MDTVRTPAAAGRFLSKSPFDDPDQEMKLTRLKFAANDLILIPKNPARSLQKLLLFELIFFRSTIPPVIGKTPETFDFIRYFINDRNGSSRIVFVKALTFIFLRRPVIQDSQPMRAAA
jgi:hypothetical protein